MTKKKEKQQNNSVIIGKDLVINTIKCIDAAATRGAYQGGELSTVGSIRDNLYTLVSSEIKEAEKAAEEKQKSDD